MTAEKKIRSARVSRHEGAAASGGDFFGIEYVESRSHAKLPIASEQWSGRRRAARPLPRDAQADGERGSYIEEQYFADEHVGDERVTREDEAWSSGLRRRGDAAPLFRQSLDADASELGAVDEEQEQRQALLRQRRLRKSIAQSSRELDRTPVQTATAAAALRPVVAANPPAARVDAHNYDDGSRESLAAIWRLVDAVYKMTASQLCALLLKRVLYNEDDLIAFDKPYGLACEGGTDVSLPLTAVFDQLLAVLAPHAKQLHLLHRIDQNATGVVLVAKSKLRASEVQEMFSERRIVKKYWCMTKDVPDPSTGCIRFPLKNRKVDWRSKVTVVGGVGVRRRRIQTVPARGEGDGGDAETTYRVMCEGERCASVECVAFTGAKHQVRAHLAYGLDCPILGDHKFNDESKFLPQRLPSEVLRRLGLRSSKARHLPMHLHARQIMIPDYETRSHVTIEAPLPKAFVFVANKLRLIGKR